MVDNDDISRRYNHRLYAVSECVHERNKHVLVGCKCDMFCRQTFKFGVGGCCQLDLFSLNKIFFARIFRRLE